MLERTAGCVESGTLRRLLPISKKSVRSRRTLHSGFWTHSTTDLEHSPLWVALVQASSLVVDQHEAQVIAKNAAAPNTLLDFLYPAGTLNFLRTYSGWWAHKQDGSLARLGLRRMGHRQYTSSATETPDPSRQSTQATQGLNAVEDFREKGLMELYETLAISKSDDYDRAWDKFMLLEGVDQRPLRSTLIYYLSASDRIVDAERTTDLFDLMEEELKDTDTYRWVIRAYLKLRNLPAAEQQFAFGYADLKMPAGSEELMAYYIRNSSWPEAVTLWGNVCRTSPDLPEKHIFKALDTVPNLAMLTSDLIDYVRATTATTTTTDKTTTMKDMRRLTSGLIRRAVLRPLEFSPGLFFFLIQAIQEWQYDSKLFYEHVSDVLTSLGETTFLIRRYREARALDHVVFNVKTLQNILEEFCKKHDRLGMKEVLDDFFKMHGAPTRKAYKLCLQEFAAQGEAEIVHALFEQYVTRFPKLVVDSQRGLTVHDMLPILQVHTVRGEINKVVEFFSRIQSEFGFRPTIRCWNILINAYGKVHNFDKALESFEAVLADPALAPDHYTFGTMLGICAARGDVDLAMNIDEIAANLLIPRSMAMIDALVQCYCQNDQMEQAEQLCEESLSLNSNGKSRTRMWNYVLVAYALQRDIINVNRVLQRMTAAEVEYDEYTYSALMQSLCMVGQPSHADSILQHLLPEAGFTPTHFHYAIVMGGYIGTKEIFRVFETHRRMKDQPVLRSASTNNLLFKAVVQDTIETADPGTGEPDFRQAMELFQNAFKTQDNRDLASTTRKGFKRKSLDVAPLDIAYPSMFHGYFMFVLGKWNQFKSVDALYDSFKSFIPEADGRRSLGVLSAYMASKVQEEEYGTVQECWELARSEAKRVGGSLPSLRIHPDQPKLSEELSAPRSILLERTEREVRDPRNKILPSHELILSRHLSYYMRSLFQQNKGEELQNAVDELRHDGFHLTNFNWNLYISLLARKFDLLRAMVLCEEILMPNWTGWGRQRRPPAQRSVLSLEIRRQRKLERFYRPQQHTLLYLARGFLSIEAGAMEDTRAEKMLKRMVKDCPKTVNALRTLRRDFSEVEKQILDGD